LNGRNWLRCRDHANRVARQPDHGTSRQQYDVPSGNETTVSARLWVREVDARSVAFSSVITSCRLRREGPPPPRTFSCDVEPTTSTNQSNGSALGIQGSCGSAPGVPTGSPLGPDRADSVCEVAMCPVQRVARLMPITCRERGRHLGLGVVVANGSTGVALPPHTTKSTGIDRHSATRQE